MTLVTDGERFEVPLDLWGDTETHSVLSAIWKCRRAIPTNEAEVDPAAQP